MENELAIVPYHQFESHTNPTRRLFYFIHPSLASEISRGMKTGKWETLCKLKIGKD